MVRTRSVLLICCLSIFTVSAFAQTRITAPIERNEFRNITSYDSLQHFLAQLALLPGISVEPIAVTKLGRNVSAVKLSSGKFGSGPKKLKVLLFAQQHGDEPSGKEAMTLLLAKIASGGKTSMLKAMDLIIVPQMNPDGAELRQRRTSDLFDMNRNHLILTLAETKGLHDLYDAWKPDVTMDIHEYTSSKEWSDSGMIRTGDVLLGMLTHPNTSAKIRDLQHNGFFPFIAETMKKKGFRFHEYIVGSPDTRLRQSTTEINDGRQSLGIQGSVSFIQEGLKRYGLEDSLRRRATAHLTSIEALLEYCVRHSAEIRTLVKSERARLPKMKGTSLALRTERAVGTARMEIPVYNVRSNADTVWNVVPYQSVIEIHRSGIIPAGYVVPQHLSAIIDLLQRHHIRFETVSAKRSITAEIFTMDSLGTEIVEEDPKPDPIGRWSTTTIDVQPGDVIVRTNQLRSLTIAIALEPESVWGLIGYAGFDSLLNKPGKYPIARIVP